MKPEQGQHAISSFSSLLLFFVFILFLLPVLILAAGAYQSSVEGKDVNDNLYTASTYLVTKFHQYDGEGHSIEKTDFGGYEALCFGTTVEGKAYRTYLYLTGGELKELYSRADSKAAPGMGSSIAHLSSFTIQEQEPGLFLFTLEDPTGRTCRVLLHAGLPGAERSFPEEVA